jgi:cytidylate kinase
MPVITISRTFGSEGATIGNLLAKKLEYRYFGREELEKTAVDGGYLRADVKYMDEKPFPLFNLLFTDQPKAYLSFIHDKICDMAEDDNVVIIGRGGKAILRDLPTAFHVKVDAPLEDRIPRIMARLGESEASVRKLIKRVDMERDSFVRQAFGIDPNDAFLYHMVINTGKMEVDDAVKVLYAAFKQMPWEKMRSAGRGFLKQYRTVKAIRNELIRHNRISCPSRIDVRIDNHGIVTLMGRLTYPDEKALIETTVRRVRGVKGVVNQLVK